MTVLATARELHRLGISVIALPTASKKPASGQGWRWYSYRQPDSEALSTMFADPHGNIAAVGGRVSGNLIMLDADSPKSLRETLRVLEGLGALEKVWIRQRPPNGSAHDGGGLVMLRSSDSVRSRKVDDLDVRS